MKPLFSLYENFQKFSLSQYIDTSRNIEMQDLAADAPELGVHVNGYKKVPQQASDASHSPSLSLSSSSAPFPHESTEISLFSSAEVWKWGAVLGIVDGKSFTVCLPPSSSRGLACSSCNRRCRAITANKSRHDFGREMCIYHHHVCNISASR